MPAATLLSLGRLLLPLVLLLLSFTNNLVLSTHFNCTWQPGKAAPETYGYVQYCEAGVIAGVANNTTTTAEYRCSPGGGGQRDAKVADWGVLGSKLLEWCKCNGSTGLARGGLTVLASMPHTDTPCGNPGGYGLNEKHLCLSSHWALCVSGKCLYMASGDDCA